MQNPADNNLLHPNDNSVVVCVLTGGPCGGKSSSLNHLRMLLEKAEYDVLTVPEVPTILMSNGAQFPGMDGNRENLLAYESQLIKLQLAMEDTFVGIARSTKRRSVVICDRGSLDVAAYMPRDLWHETLVKVGITREDLLQRYDIVCHLVTAANGEEDVYQLMKSNNTTRTEDVESAKELDNRTQACWNDHSNFLLVENPESNGVDDSTNLRFQRKLDVVGKIILETCQRIFLNRKLDNKI